MGASRAASAQREANRIARESFEFSKQQAEDARREREEQRAIVQTEKKKFEEIQFENIY